MKSGVGLSPIHEKKKKIRRTLLDNNSRLNLSFALQFVAQHLQPLAYGIRTLTLSHNEILEVPKLTLLLSAQELKTRYLFAIEDLNNSPNEDADNTVIEPVIDSHFDAIVKALCGGQNTNLAALDSVYAKSCIDNFKNARLLVEDLTKDDDVGRKALIELIENLELYLSKVYPDHLRMDSCCAAHSFQHAFNETDDAIIRDKFCEDCDIVLRFVQSMELAITKNTYTPSDDTMEETLDYFRKRIVHDMEIYIAHVVRKTFESINKDKIINSMDMADTAVLIYDFKMKLMSMAYRESMVDFFGKRGIVLFGMAFTRYKTDDEFLDDRVDNAYKSNLKTEYIDTTTNESSEDSWNTFAMILEGIKAYKIRNPHITKIIVQSDGAGALKSYEMLLLLYHIADLNLGIKIIDQFISVEGCGKSHLDAHFLYLLIKLNSVVANGRGSNDVKCAEDIARALQTDGGIRNTFVHCVSINSPPEKQDLGDLKGISEYYRRKLEYNDDGTPLRILCFKVPYFRDQPDLVLLAIDLIKPNLNPSYLPILINTSTGIIPVPLKRRQTEQVNCPSDRLEKNERKSFRVRKKANKQQEKDNREKLRIEQRVANLKNAFVCTSCNKIYYMKGAFLKHEEKCTINTLTQDTNLDQIKRAATHTLVNIPNLQKVSTVASRSARNRTDSYKSHDQIDDVLYDGETRIRRVEIDSFITKRIGFGHKKGSISSRLKAKHLDLVIKFHERDLYSSKMFPNQCEIAMRLHGTIKGAQFLKDTQYDRDIMLPNDGNIPTFKRLERLTHYQIKGLLGQPITKLKASHAKLKAKEELQLAVRSNPLLQRIYSMNRPELVSKLRQIHINHEIALTDEEIQIKQHKNTKIPQLKNDLYELIHTQFNRDPNDMALFGALVVDAIEEDDDVIDDILNDIV